MPVNSCLVAKLSDYMNLTDSQKKILARTEESSQTLKRGQSFSVKSGANEKLYVVKKGWLMSEREPIAGQKVITRLYLPGDIVGLDEVSVRGMRHKVVACNEAVVCPFHSSTLDDIFSQDPKLTKLFFYVMGRDHLLTMEVLTSISCQRSTARLGAYLLILRQRKMALSDTEGNEMELPLTQIDLARAIDLSQQHINISTKELREKGFLEIKQRRVSFKDLPGLEEYCSFDSKAFVVSPLK